MLLRAPRAALPATRRNERQSRTWIPQLIAALAKEAEDVLEAITGGAGDRPGAGLVLGWGADPGRAGVIDLEATLVIAYSDKEDASRLGHREGSCSSRWSGVRGHTVPVDATGLELCEACAIADDLRRRRALVNLADGWTMNAAVHWTSRPWFVVQPVAHRESLADLTEAEAVALGPALAAVTGAVNAVIAPARTYVLLLNELVPPHVHFHVVARFPDDPPEVRGPALLGKPVRGRPWAPDVLHEVATVLTSR